jgi:hypothetical protein
VIVIASTGGTPSGDKHGHPKVTDPAEVGLVASLSWWERQKPLTL